MRDEEIVGLYWARDEEAIMYTSQKYGKYLMKISYNVLSDYQDSEECVNDTYLRTWNLIPNNRPQVLSSFLGKITRSLAVDLYRKKHAKKRFASEFACSLSELSDTFSDGKTPEDDLNAQLLFDALQAFLRQLPQNSRNMFIGRYYFFDSIKEIADYCGVAEGTVKSSLHRTRQALKEYLLREGVSV